MKFLCAGCDEAMPFQSQEGPHRGSLSIYFTCPKCGIKIGMLTNPQETQLLKTFGVRLGPEVQSREGVEKKPLEASLSDLKHRGSLMWTEGSLKRLERVPPFAREMAKRSIEGYAREHNYSVITEEVMDEARKEVGI